MGLSLGPRNGQVHCARQPSCPPARWRTPVDGLRPAPHYNWLRPRGRSLILTSQSRGLARARLLHSVARNRDFLSWALVLPAEKAKSD